VWFQGNLVLTTREAGERETGNEVGSRAVSTPSVEVGWGGGRDCMGEVQTINQPASTTHKNYPDHELG